jgi:hypothetical protein
LQPFTPAYHEEAAKIGACCKGMPHWPMHFEAIRAAAKNIKELRQAKEKLLKDPKDKDAL